MSNASQEMRERWNGKVFPGFDKPLEFCPIRPKHREALLKAIWKSQHRLRGFIGWAKYVRSWNIKTILRFIDDHINDPIPNQHFVFIIGDQIVGMGSLVKAYTDMDAQIALWITSGFEGKGIGKAIVATLEDIAFKTWGFEVLYYEHDALNEASKRLPQKCGFVFSHVRDLEKSAEGESGFWFSWKKIRPTNLPDAIFQGRPIEDFIVP